MEFISGSTLESQLPGLNLTQQYAVSELLVSLLQKSHLIQLPASGRIKASPNMEDKGTPCLWTSDQHRNVIAIQSMSSTSDNQEYTTMTPTLADVNFPKNAERAPTLLRQLRRKLESWMDNATGDEELAFADDCDTLKAILDFFESANLLEPSCSVLWHQDLAPRNLLLDWDRWESEGIVDGILIDWDGVIAAPKEYTFFSPEQFMLQSTRFAKTLTQESKRDLHDRSMKLMSKAFSDCDYAQIAINNVLSTLITITNEMFTSNWVIELSNALCQDWEQPDPTGSSWRAVVSQDGYCSLNHPPPATRFEDSDDSEDTEATEAIEDTEAGLSDNTGRMTCEVARCKELNEVVEIDDLTTKHGIV